jgi:UDP-glucose 4-epimerase
MTKAMVTGGAGFIGSNVARLLAADGYDVVVLDNLATGYRKNLEALKHVRLVEGDVRDANVLYQVTDGAEVIFHLAASVGNTRSIENPVDDSDINVLGTLRVLEAARHARVRKVVCSSSAAIFGELKHLPIREDHPCEPDTPYGVSKLAEEKHCLRYFNVYGVNQRYDAYGNVIPIFAHRMLRGDTLTIYDDGEQTRDFVNVRDVARANIQAAETRDLSGAFNVASGEAITVNHLVQLMREASGIEPSIKHEAPRKGDVRNSRADISAASAAFRYQPTVNLLEGLTEYMAWARSNLS